MTKPINELKICRKCENDKFYIACRECGTDLHKRGEVKLPIDPRLKELDKMLTITGYTDCSYEKYYWIGQARLWLNGIFPELND